MDLAFLPARRLAAMVRRREIGCLELADHMIARIERLDGPINAVVVRDFERARARALALDSAPPTGTLHGVPITVKESFDAAGLPSTWGVAAYRDNVAAEDSLVVSRLRAAGAVLLGKTNVPAMLADWQSFNPVHGSTANPWDLARTPGGSSGGSAAALAAGFSALEFGSDIGGSVRQPAHVCGVFGHKPSHGLVPMTGHALRPGGAPGDLSVAGPLARSAADLALAFALTARPDPAVSEAGFHLPAPGLRGLARLRVAVWASEPGQPTDGKTTAALLGLADFLERQGARVDRAARPGFPAAEAYRVYLRLLGATYGARMDAAAREALRARIAARAPDDAGADAVMDGAAEMSRREWLEEDASRHRLIRLWTRFFRDWDVLLCPVIATPALPHMQAGSVFDRPVVVDGTTMGFSDMLFWPGLVTGCLLPATVAPLGRTRGGLPIGVQIVGPLHGDWRTLLVARLLERAWLGFAPPPGFSA